MVSIKSQKIQRQDEETGKMSFYSNYVMLDCITAFQILDLVNEYHIVAMINGGGSYLLGTVFDELLAEKCLVSVLTLIAYPPPEGEVSYVMYDMDKIIKENMKFIEKEKKGELEEYEVTEGEEQHPMFQ